MNSLCLAPSFTLPPTSRLVYAHTQLRPRSACSYYSLSTRHCRSSSPFPSLPNLSRPSKDSVHATLTPDEGEVAVVDFEDLIEKDWSILDIDETNTKEERGKKMDRVIAAGNIGDKSKVLVSVGSDDFVDRLFDTSPSKSLLLVHESLFFLAGIKEKYDLIKCWQGELIHVPQNWAPFDAVYLYCLPALSSSLDDIFAALSSFCSPGARVVISHLQGKQVLEQQRQQYPDVVVSTLPDRRTLEKVATDHSFSVIEFVDEQGSYLAVVELRA